MNSPNDRRLQILWVRPEIILTMLGGWRLRDRLVLPEFDGLPADVKLLGCHEDYGRRAIGFCLWSATFDEVPDGAMIPSFEKPFGFKCRVAHLVGKGLGTMAGQATYHVPDDEPQPLLVGKG